MRRYVLAITRSVDAEAYRLVTDKQDFVSSVSTLLTIRQGTGHLRRRIGELDGQMGDVGRALGEKVCCALDVLRRLISRNGHYWNKRKSPKVWTTLLKLCRPV